MNTTLLLIEETAAPPKRMSLEQFLEELRLVRNEFQWRCIQRDDFCFPGAALIRAAIGEINFCPITAVVMSKQKTSYHMNKYSNAAAEIGLPEDLALMIAEAADAPFYSNTELLDLHNQMLEVLGL